MFKEQTFQSEKDWPSLIQKIHSSQNLESFFSWVNFLSIKSNTSQKWTHEEKVIFKKGSMQNSQNGLNFLNDRSNIFDRQLVSVTLNVLFDFRGSEQPDKDRGHMKFSHQRYTEILKKLEKMQCDVITLNEVTRPFVKMIEETDWIRKSYHISTLHDSFKSIQSFGNILITKLKPLALHLLKVPGLPRVIPIGFFLISKENGKITKYEEPRNYVVTFSSIHLIAYDINASKRQKQLKAIKDYLNLFEKDVDQHILQGDMNFHSEKENLNSESKQLLDAWLTVHKIKNQNDLKLNPGYTFDAINNFFTKELYWGFEKRRMRLDRIFYTKGETNFLVPVEIKIEFNEPIYLEEAQEPSYNILKSSVSFLADKMNWNLFRNKEKYLFCSDHFGLYCKFKIGQ